MVLLEESEEVKEEEERRREEEERGAEGGVARDRRANAELDRSAFIVGYCSKDVSASFAHSVWLSGCKSATSVAAGYNRGNELRQKGSVESGNLDSPSRRKCTPDAIPGTLIKTAQYGYHRNKCPRQIGGGYLPNARELGREEEEKALSGAMEVEWVSLIKLRKEAPKPDVTRYEGNSLNRIGLFL